MKTRERIERFRLTNVAADQLMISEFVRNATQTVENVSKMW